MNPDQAKAAVVVEDPYFKGLRDGRRQALTMITKLAEDEWGEHVSAAPTSPDSSRLGEGERFFIEHGVVHDRKTDKHLGPAHSDATPENLLAVLRELETDRDAWRLTAKTFSAAERLSASPGVAGDGVDWRANHREACQLLVTLVELVKHMYVMADGIDGMNFDGKPVSDIVSELIAADSLAELTAALGTVQRG